MNSILGVVRTFRSGLADRMAFLLAAALSLTLFCSPLFSQGSNGRILGTITDQSGGVVVGATATIIDRDRGVARTLTTDDAGEYNAPNLIPGTYTVRAEAKGFSRLDRENLEVGVGKEVRVDLVLQPGTQAQTLTVTESLPMIETTNATMGGTLESTQIQDMPLNGRNYQSLLGLRPGVMLQPGGGSFTQSTNNIRPDESVWMVDGVLNENTYDGRPLAGVSSPISDGAAGNGTRSSRRGMGGRQPRYTALMSISSSSSLPAPRRNWTSPARPMPSGTRPGRTPLAPDRPQRCPR